MRSDQPTFLSPYKSTPNLMTRPFFLLLFRAGKKWESMRGSVAWFMAVFRLPSVSLLIAPKKKRWVWWCREGGKALCIVSYTYIREKGRLFRNSLQRTVIKTERRNQCLSRIPPQGDNCLSFFKRLSLTTVPMGKHEMPAFPLWLAEEGREGNYKWTFRRLNTKTDQSFLPLSL